MAKSHYQKYKVEKIHRSKIKNADYNPRRISASSRAKLQEALKTHGLVEPLVWNRETGNLVGGHQRLQALDVLEGHEDYELDVSVIEVDERDEAIINVQLNNPSLQGDWDTDLLADLILSQDLKIEELGFEQLDIDFLFEGNDVFSELYEPPDVQIEKEKIAEIKEAKKEARIDMSERDAALSYAVVVFADEDEKDNFYKGIGLPPSEDVLTLEQVGRYFE